MIEVSGKKCNCGHAWLTAAAVILFPDPNSYILTKKDQLGVLPQDVSPTQNVKFVSGDPSSPFVDSYGKNLTTPGIPVVSISSNQANVILSNFTDAFNVSRSYWYGLALRQNMHRNFTASVEVYQEFKPRCVKGPFIQALFLDVFLQESPNQSRRKLESFEKFLGFFLQNSLSFL